MRCRALYFCYLFSFMVVLCSPFLDAKAYSDEPVLSLSEQLLYNTVRIECRYKDNTKGVGTGFFFVFPGPSKSVGIPIIVTNRHVVENAVEGSFFISVPPKRDGESAKEGTNNQFPAHPKIHFQDFEKQWIFHPEDDVDLCVLPIANLHRLAEALGRRINYIPVGRDLIPTDNALSELTAAADIIMVGYPIGLWDEKNHLPILRSGRTATPADVDHNGREEFLIDAAVFPGSSGSPVYLFERVISYKKKGADIGKGQFFLLGVAYAIPRYTAKGNIEIIKIPTNIDTPDKIPLATNLGYIIKSKKILDFEKILLERNK